ncbi:transmembrane protein 61 [Ochotona princeps]|uniref:transmembrane protein 61 n=1 Tax=Ochotona princeps TaxID=9978 RepID=UPI0027151DAD|nr:transmembrane protein 61 [Ochotona princeps]
MCTRHRVASAGHRMASAIRCCMMAGGTVVLVTGTLCFAWWSEGDVGIQPVQQGSPSEHPAPAAPSPLLRSVSFLCCGVGGLLLLFGLLWSVLAGAAGPPPGDPYHCSRHLYYLTTTEASGKEGCRTPKVVAMPTHADVMRYSPAETLPAPPAYSMEEDLQDHAPGDAILGTPPPFPPPSYESIVLDLNPISGETSPVPGAVCTGR